MKVLVWYWVGERGAESDSTDHEEVMRLLGDIVIIFGDRMSKNDLLM